MDRVTLRHAIAGEVRAEAARRRITGRQLADLLGGKHSTTARKLRGDYPFDAEELLALAAAWDVPVSRFLDVCAVRDLNPEPAGNDSGAYELLAA